jgi:hypothetical protein
VLLSDEIAKRDRSARIADSRQSAIDTAVEVSHLAVGASSSVAKRISQGVIAAGLWSLIVIVLIAKSTRWNTQHLIFNFGYYMGYGGFVLVLLAAITGPYWLFDDTKSWGKGLFMLMMTGATLAVLIWVEEGFK